MKKIIGKFILLIFGWKIIGKDLDLYKIQKSVLVCAPHTSNWDFIFCTASLWILNIPFRIFIKNYYTKSFFGWVFKKMGCIGVDRSKKNNLVQYASNLILESEKMSLVNTPEATRGYAQSWKRGFYYIAKESKVPIVFCFADYKKKEAGVIGIVERVEDKTCEQVLSIAEKLYRVDMAKYPELFNPKFY